ncbi:hypothetical protein GF371_03145 [Candidatus Woesearchaeota archaeon]|nr:hypothetical protein [Candidatus Woesearchaeota archaeon]
MIYDEGMYFDDEFEELFGSDIYERQSLDQNNENEELDLVGEGFMQGYIDAGYAE